MEKESSEFLKAITETGSSLIYNKERQTWDGVCHIGLFDSGWQAMKYLELERRRRLIKDYIAKNRLTEYQVDRICELLILI